MVSFSMRDAVTTTSSRALVSESVTSARSNNEEDKNKKEK
jgi:hypothetical protein